MSKVYNAKDVRLTFRGKELQMTEAEYKESNMEEIAKRVWDTMRSRPQFGVEIPSLPWDKITDREREAWKAVAEAAKSGPQAAALALATENMKDPECELVLMLSGSSLEDIAANDVEQNKQTWDDIVALVGGVTETKQSLGAVAYKVFRGEAVRSSLPKFILEVVFPEDFTKVSRGNRENLERAAKVAAETNDPELAHDTYTAETGAPWSEQPGEHNIDLWFAITEAVVKASKYSVKVVNQTFPEGTLCAGEDHQADFVGSWLDAAKLRDTLRSDFPRSTYTIVLAEQQ